VSLATHLWVATIANVLCDLLSALLAAGARFAEAPWRKRVQAGALFLAVAAAVFAPWPLRNQLQFGAPHPEGTTVIKQDGTPMPASALTWFRTWASGKPGEAFLMLLTANELPLDPHRPNVLIPPMYDDPAEKAAVAGGVRALQPRALHARRW
jgi:hypothetical protein